MNKDDFNIKLRSLGVGIKNIYLSGEYKGYTTKTEFTCKRCNTTWDETPLNILTKVSRCPKCNVNFDVVGGNRRNGKNALKSQEHFKKEFVNKLGNKFELLSEYKGSSRYINIRCKKCGHIFPTKGYHVIAGETACPVCSGRVVVPWINSISVTNPDIVKWLVNPDDAISYSKYSNKSLDFSCPYCGYTFKKPLIWVVNSMNLCSVCKRGISFPNKVIRNLLRMCSNQVKFYKEEWKIPQDRMILDKMYRFDMYFVIDDKEYVVEMDGEYHDYDEQTKINDTIKEVALKKMGIDLIRVNCRGSSMEIIKNNLLNSKLSKVLSLEDIDWCELNYLCQSNELNLKILELYNSGKGSLEIKNIIRDRKVTISYIRNFLFIAGKNGKCIFRVVKFKNHKGKNYKYFYLDDPYNCASCYKAISMVDNSTKYYLSKNALYRDMSLPIDLQCSFTDECDYNGYRFQKVSNMEMYLNNKELFEDVDQSISLNKF